MTTVLDCTRSGLLIAVVYLANIHGYDYDVSILIEPNILVVSFAIHSSEPGVSRSRYYGNRQQIGQDQNWIREEDETRVIVVDSH